ncbi:MAG: cation diffusion facilitator family transporter [Alphaproteobacteria bacterium]|nr:cation diffusion facilitator family transporter [Alphaproteobacteria bacterium]
MKEKKHLNGLLKAASIASISTAILLIGVKVLAYLVTGSVSILSSLFDSVQDFMTSAVNYAAVRHSTQPADNEHRFGHGKAEAIGSLVQGIIILAAAFFLLKESLHRFFETEPIKDISLGVWITIFAIIVTIILVRFQSYVIKKTNSLSIKADQAHYTGDILMNVGVIVSMLAAHYFEFYVIDALFGIGVASYLFYVVFGVAKEAIAMLMDTELDESIRKSIEKEALSFKEVKAVIDLKTRKSGDIMFIQFCAQMNSDLTLKKAHDIADLIEEGIQKKYAEAQIIIHLEPALEKDKK